MQDNEKLPKTYIYKTDAKKGGVVNLMGGSRCIGDIVFASLNRIFLGSQSIMFSVDNLIANSNQIWDWNFFGKLVSDF